MTDHRCIPVEELGRVRELTAGDPERVHAETCPRCRAALLALAEFEHADEALPAAAGAERARARLDAVIDSLVAPAGAAAAATPARARAPREDGWLARLFAPGGLRLAAGFAVVAVVALSTLLLVRGPGQGPARVVRGDSATEAALVVTTIPAGWELRWAPVTGADTYDAVFLDVELHVVARVDGLREPRLVLDRASMPPGVFPGVPMLVEIDARAGRDVLQSAVPAAIRLD